MSCKLCDLAQKKETEQLIYEDEEIMAVMPKEQSMLGHIEVFPKKHISGLENITDNLRKHLFLCASLGATAVFEGLGAHGTNIILSDTKTSGSDHLKVTVLPRKQDDGIDLMWKPKKIDDAEQKRIQGKIKDEAFMIGKGKTKTPSPKKEQKPAESMDKNKLKQYYTREVRRIP